jgi:hypothetical protein
MRRLLIFIALFVGLPALWQAVAATDAVVIASTAPELPAGTMLLSGATVTIPEGARASFLSEAGNSITLEGPYQGIVELGSEQEDRQGTLGVIAGLLAPDGESAYALGGVRGFAPVEGPGNALWINTAHSARYCVDPGHYLHLWRPDSEERRGAKLTDLETGQSADIAWNAGEVTHAWPRSLAYRDAAAFLVTVEGQSEPVHVEVRLIRQRFESALARIAWLVEANCVAQAEAELATLRDSIDPFHLYLSTDRGSAPEFDIGDSLTLQIKANRDAAIYCFHSGADGTIALFPSRFSSGAWVEGYETLHLPGDRLPVPLTVAPPAGVERIICYGTSRDVTRDLPPALIAGNFRPISPDIASRLADIFNAIEDTRIAEAVVELRVR